MASNSISRIDLAAGDVLLHNGDDVENLYLLVKGRLTIYATYGNYTVSSGTVLALTGSNFGISTYNYVAQEDCIIQSFPCRTSADVFRICEAYPNDYTRMLISQLHFVGELIRTYLTLLMTLKKRNPDFVLDERINRWELDKYNVLSSMDVSAIDTFYKQASALAVAEMVESSRFASVLNDACLTMAEILNINKDYVAPPPKPIEPVIALEDTDVISDGGYNEADILREIGGSFEQILAYSAWPDDKKDEFRALMHQFRNTKDRMATNEESRKLRRDIKTLFYELYFKVFMNAVPSDNLPSVITMFLNFGYMDEELAGVKNAIELYKVAQDLETLCADEHVFAIHTWFKKILWNEKQPSKNGFDQSYDEYTQIEFREGHLKGDLPSLLNDLDLKLKFEFDNMFKQTHYMTFGRVSSFMPVLLSENITKPVSEMFLSAQKINDIVNHVREIDYSLFYRSRIYSNIELKIGKEQVFSEVMPDYIILPCVGSFGVMWQEIEGRNRLSSARMMFPILCNSNPESMIINTLGKYRWEMCKRIQGAYWNNITEPSLTSEYCDYLQFYKKNRDLTDSMKQKIQSGLTNCRNNFNEFFARDYESWILYESRGNGKLNRVSRKIISKYCTFSLKYRNELRSNPMFSEPIEYAERQLQSKHHHLNNIVVALEAKGLTAPQEIKDTRSFYTR